MKTIDCLKARFALPEICAPVAAGVNQLDAAMISQIDWRRLASTSDGLATATGVNELNAVFQLAAKHLYQIFGNEMRNRGLTKNAIADKEVDTGHRKATLVTAGTTGQMRGVRVFVTDSSYTQGWRRVAVTKVAVWVGAAYPALPVTFTYSDGTIETVTIAANIGQNLVPIPNGKILLGAEYVDIQLPSDTVVYSVEKYPKCGCPGVPSIPCASARTNDNGVIGDAGAKSECFGIVATIACTCDFEGLLCNIISSGVMDTILIQQINLTALRRAIESRTVSIYAPLGDNASALYGMYEKDIASENAEFYNSLRSIASAMNDGYCVVCAQGVTIKAK